MPPIIHRHRQPTGAPGPEVRGSRERDEEAMSDPPALEQTPRTSRHPEAADN